MGYATAVVPLSQQEFEDRVAWAERRGVPNWLWPDVEHAEWAAALRAIEAASRQVLSSGRADAPLQGDPEAIGLAAYTSGMGPLLGCWLEQGRLGAGLEVAEILAVHRKHNARRMAGLAEHARRVVDRMATDNIPVIVLKGLHTAFECFPSPAARPASDIDLVVAPADKRRAQQLLHILGYSAEYERKEPDEQFWRHSTSPASPQSLNFVHENDPWGIDLHTSASRRYAYGAPIIPLDELLAYVRPEPWPMHPHGKVLTETATILFLACHAGCGFNNLRIIRLAELVLVIRQSETSPAFSWDGLIELGELTGTLSHAHAALRLAAVLVPGVVPDEVLRCSRKGVPQPALGMIDRLTPAIAHTITRCSIEERYMWTRSLWGKMRQAAHDVVPIEGPASKILPTMKRRMQRIRRGTIAVRASEY